MPPILADLAPAVTDAAALSVVPGALGHLTDAQKAEIRRLAERADELVEASLSANTRQAYAAAWRQWSEWCLGFGLDPTGAGPGPAADASWLAMYLTALSETRSLSTIELRRAAVLEVRRRFGHPLHLDDNQFRAFLQGLRRTKGVRPEKKAACWRRICGRSCYCWILRPRRTRSGGCATGRCC